MKKIIIILCLLVMITGCGTTSKVETNEVQKESETVRTLDQIIKEDNYIIVDVRTKEEYKEGHVKGSLNIPYDEISKNLSKLDKNKTILVYCRSGNRSGIAYEELKSKGYDVVNIGAFDSLTLEKE